MDLYLTTRDALVEEETLEEITSLVEPVRQELEKDMAKVRQTVATTRRKTPPRKSKRSPAGTRTPRRSRGSTTQRPARR